MNSYHASLFSETQNTLLITDYTNVVLPVFPCSAWDYGRKGGQFYVHQRCRLEAHMYTHSACSDLSGIPELCKHFHGIAEQRNMNHLKDCVVEATQLAASIKLRCDKYVAISEGNRAAMRVKWASHSSTHPSMLRSRLNEVSSSSSDRNFFISFFFGRD
jgi:hypothetical protein